MAAVGGGVPVPPVGGGAPVPPAGGPAANAAAPPPPVVFARSLNDVQAGGILDLSSKPGYNVFKHGAKSLYLDTEDKYDFKPEEFPHFIQRVSERAEQCGWVDEGQTGILNVPRTVQPNQAALLVAPKYNMTTHYAKVSVLMEVRPGSKRVHPSWSW